MDEEWIELMIAARKAGISKQEISAFLSSNASYLQVTPERQPMTGKDGGANDKGSLRINERLT